MGSVGSKHRPFNKMSTLKESPEKRSLRIDWIFDWIQPEGSFDRSSSRRDSKDGLIESEMVNDHQILENPEIADHMYQTVHDQIEKEPENPEIEASVQAVPQELKKNQSVSVPKDSEFQQVSAEWPTWLVSVAGEALVNWAPRRASTFEKLEKIGQGTYSSVYRAHDLIHNKIVALKKVRFDLKDMESVKFMAREIIVMRRLDHPNVMKLEGLITAPVSSSLYLVFEYMDHDLLGLSSLPGIKFSEPQVKCYMQQLLSGLEHCHSRGVLHRDIKGSNLLIDSNGVLKIADFGLATFYDPTRSVPLTNRVVTLWYRPPELLLGACYYSIGVDLWSTGCILGELYAGKPILPGKTEVEQLHKIFKLCGSPTENFCRKQKLPSSSDFKTRIPYRRKVSEVFKDFPASVLSLLETLISIDPDHRGSAYSALDSEYFKTKPLACDPSYLPKYPPSKEFDAKIRDEAKRQQPIIAEIQESQRIRSHGSFRLNKEERSSHGGRVSNSGPFMSNRNIAKATKENEPPRYPPSKVNPKMLSGSVFSKDQPDMMNQRRRDLIKPIDPSLYTPCDMNIYMTGPLLAQPSKVDQMLEEHDRQLQEVNRQAQKKQEGKTGK